MNRSLLPTLKAGLSRLHLYPQRRMPAAEAGLSWPHTERRVTDRRRRITDFRHRELRLRAAAQVSGTGVYDFDFATGTNYWSPELKAIAGLPDDQGELSLEQMTRIAHPEDSGRFMQQVEASLDPRGDGRFEGEYRIMRPDGSLRWVRVRGRTFFASEAPERHVLGASGIVIDITELMRAEEALKTFKFFSDHSNDSNLIWDAEGRIRYANRRLCERTGYSEEEMLRLRVQDVAPLATDIQFQQLVEGTQDGTLAPFEALRRRKDGSTYPVEVSATALEVEGEWLIFSVARDITERKRAEQALKDNERRLAMALEASGSVVWEADLAAGTVHGGDRLFTQLGYAPGELTTRDDWFSRMHGDDREAALRELEEVIQGRQVHYRRDVRFRAKDGSWLWIASHIMVAERNAEGRAVRLIGTHTDITERKQAEEQIRASETRFHSTFEQMAVGLAHISLDGLLLRVNAKFAAIVGYDRQALEHMRFQELTHPDDLEKDLDSLAGLLAGSIAGYTLEKRYIRKDRTVIWCNLTVSLVRTATGEPDYFVGGVEDIQARKEAEWALTEERESRQRLLTQQVAERTAELAHANEALLQSNTELKHFAHATAHDLQTPLRSIAGFTQLLQKEVEGRVSEQVDAWSAAVVENTRRLQILIQEILSYTRLETQGRPFEMTDLRKLFDEVVSSLAALTGETGAEVTGSALPTLPVDRTQMAQVFQNLIENGIKYNRSTPPRVAVSSEFQDGRWVFSVADNGIGIDPKHYDRVFALFQRLHPYHQFPGTGIGVPLCRRIIERHGGHMWIESRPGEGSTFYFSLPTERDEGL